VSQPNKISFKFKLIPLILKYSVNIAIKPVLIVHPNNPKLTLPKKSLYSIYMLPVTEYLKIATMIIVANALKNLANVNATTAVFSLVVTLFLHIVFFVVFFIVTS